jgi:hypothetical protein
MSIGFALVPQSIRVSVTSCADAAVSAALKAINPNSLFMVPPLGGAADGARAGHKWKVTPSARDYSVLARCISIFTMTRIEKRFLSAAAIAIAAAALGARASRAAEEETREAAQEKTREAGEAAGGAAGGQAGAAAGASAGAAVGGPIGAAVGKKVGEKAGEKAGESAGEEAGNAAAREATEPKSPGR